jgi:hypothetical protein
MYAYTGWTHQVMALAEHAILAPVGVYVLLVLLHGKREPQVAY